MKLYKHQQDLVKKNPDKWLLAHGTGTGKTVTAIKLADNNPCDTLVICPKQVFQKWEQEIRFWSDNSNNFQVMTKEEFRKDTKIPKYSCIIVDEAHYFAGRSSQMTKSLDRYIDKHNPQYRYFLTATPYMSTPWNIYCYAIMLGQNWGYKRFENKFFYKMRMGKRIIPVIRKDIQEDIAGLVRQLGNTVQLQDCMDVPEQTFLTEYFDLTKEQKEGIANITDIQHIVKWTKTHQICGGTLKSDGYIEDQTFKSEKMKRVLELIKENKKIAVVCRYNHEIEVIKNSIKKRTVVILNGKTKDKEALIKQIHSTDDIVVLVNAAVSEGYSLETIPIMVFYSYDFSLKNYIQMCGRLLRANALKKNVYISLVVKDTIDEDVFKNVTIKKKDFQIKIYEGKRLPNKV